MCERCNKLSYNYEKKIDMQCIHTFRNSLASSGSGDSWFVLKKRRRERRTAYSLFNGRDRIEYCTIPTHDSYSNRTNNIYCISHLGFFK